MILTTQEPRQKGHCKLIVVLSQYQDYHKSSKVQLLAARTQNLDISIHRLCHKMSRAMPGHWRNGALEHSNIGRWENWQIGTLENWKVGTWDHWNVGPLEDCAIETLGHWNFEAAFTISMLASQCLSKSTVS